MVFYTVVSEAKFIQYFFASLHFLPMNILSVEIISCIAWFLKFLQFLFRSFKFLASLNDLTGKMPNPRNWRNFEKHTMHLINSTGQIFIGGKVKMQKNTGRFWMPNNHFCRSPFTRFCWHLSEKSNGLQTNQRKTFFKQFYVKLS